MKWLILGNIWDEPEASYSVRKYTNAKTKKTVLIMSKGYSTQLKELLMQSFNNLNNKKHEVILDYNPKYKMNIHEPCWYK